MKRHNVLGMAVGCYLAAFKKDERGPILLGFNHIDEVKARAAEVLGVDPESVRHWMQEFIPYWAKSKRQEIFPEWAPCDLKGRRRENDKIRESRSRMFANFELKKEKDFVDICKAILDMSNDPRFDRAYFDSLARPYLRKSEQESVFSSSEVAERAVANELPKVKNKPEGNLKPEKRRAALNGFVYARDLEVVSWALSRSKGYCELCACLGPFVTKEGGRFLEVHHITPLFEGGPDIVDNVAAVCPNCHRACHLAQNRDELAASLRQKLADKIV